jgi:hypothetical protein
MIIKIQSVHALCVALFTAHERRRNITGPLENCPDMCLKPYSGRVSVKMKLTHTTVLQYGRLKPIRVALVLVGLTY